MTQFPARLRSVDFKAVVRRSIHPWPVLTVLMIALAGANAWIVKHRHEGFLFRHVPYVEAYHPSELLRVTGLVAGRGDLELITAPKRSGRWRIERRVPEAAPETLPEAAPGAPAEAAPEAPAEAKDASGKSDEPGTAGNVPPRWTSLSASQGPDPRLSLEAGVHRYRLTQAGEHRFPRALSLTLVHTPASPSAPDHLAQGATTISSLSVPFGEVHTHPLSELAFQREDVRGSDLEAARRELEQMNLPSGDTEARIASLASYLLKRLNPHRGTPSDEMYRGLSPHTQYERAIAGEDEVFCANFSSIYRYFAALAGIPTREISVTGTRDGVSLGAHTFNESFIPERGEWAYVDLTLEVVLPRTAKGDRLDAIELSHLHRLDATEGVRAYAPSGSGLALAPYDAHSRFSRIYLNDNATYLFHRPEANRHTRLSQLRRMFFEPELAYAHRPDNTKYWVKTGVFAAFVASAALWVLWSTVFLLRKRGRHRSSRRDGRA
jgi:hypothetical protein